MTAASAFSPAGISSFFEIHDRKPNGKPFSNLVYAGARGGGFVISRGVKTEVSARPSASASIRVRINGRTVKNSTSERVARRILSRVVQSFAVQIDHFQELPIGAGYGTSAASALSTCLAVSKSLRMALTLNEAGRAAHIAEIENHTGLGTVGGIMRGGLAITTKSGGPGTGVVDRIPIDSGWKIVSACFGPIHTRTILTSDGMRRRVNAAGKDTLERILSDPTLENFMSSCKEFAEKLGLLRKRTRDLISVMEDAGALCATQNMVGDAVHGAVTVDEAERVLRRVKSRFSQSYSFLSDIDLEGVRIL